MLAGCAKEPVHQEQAYVFGTLVEVTTYGEPQARAQELTQAVLAEFDRLHRELHPWQPGPMADINAAYARSPQQVTVSAELAAVLRDATRYSEQSGGLFDPAIGRLVALWGFHEERPQAAPPDSAQLQRLVAARPRMTDIAVDGTTTWSRNAAVQVDLGGYAKGYALDRAAQLLRARGAGNALINIGGSLIALGRHGDRPWRIGIRDPRKPGPIATLDLHDGEAIGTSGDYQRYFEFGGRRYCHIIDPRSGMPASGAQSVTVLAPPSHAAGTLSDVASKPIFLEATGDWRAAARRMGVESVLLVNAHGEAVVTAALAGRLAFEDRGRRVQSVP